MNDSHDRYRRQILLREIGSAGQDKINGKTAVIIGCGALGCATAEILTRAGVGRIRLADRDFVELSNLQRQVLFDESDAAERLPKATAARRKLSAINSVVSIEDNVVDITPRNVEEIIQGADVVLDGTDNAETRFLINDACIKHDIPWVYGGAVGMEGLAAALSPDGPCLRCFLPEPPPPGSLATCDSQGVLSTSPLTTAAMQATEALKLLLGDNSGIGVMTTFDIWNRRFRTVRLRKAVGCPACGERTFPFLEATSTSRTSRLCGRCAVQITPAGPAAAPVDLEQLGQRLRSAYACHFNGILLTVKTEQLEIIIFPDGRSIVKGTLEESVARTVLARILAN